MHEKILKVNQLTLGVCYYPEHWPESMWEDDLTRMRSYGISVVRIGEFAWTILEPSEGQYSFTFFDRFVKLAEKHGMKIIFGTPTAIPPIWMTEKYPEVLNAKRDGTLYRHGMRRHYNYNSKAYNEFSAAIVEQLAEHYCENQTIIGWQIDNELNCETDVFYANADDQAFREYLKKRFRTLNDLNAAMGTTFWNQTYTSWNDVHLSRTLIHDDSNNPHLSLEEKRFFSESAISFCKMQADILRKHNKLNQFITTNGIHGHLDSHKMTDEALDFICYDNYPCFSFEENATNSADVDLHDRRSSANLSLARSISPVFGIMEQQSGSGGWCARIKQPEPRPGQMRLWTLQAVAHGADYIGYYRWRTCTVGTEIYWQGLNDWSNQPNRKLGELEKIKEDFEVLGEIAGTRYKAKAAILNDYSNIWDGEQDHWHGPIDQVSRENFFAAAQTAHVPTDMVFMRDTTSLNDLLCYDLLFYPHATILTEKCAALLESYVNQGGKLIMGARTGYKDQYGKCNGLPVPGFVSKLCGLRVTDATGTFKDEIVLADWDGQTFNMPQFNEILEPSDGTQVLARYSNEYYAGSPALVYNQYGKGQTYYLGSGFSYQLSLKLLEYLGVSEPFRSFVRLPQNVEIALRSGNGNDYIFLLNYSNKDVDVEVFTQAINLIDGKTVSENLALKPYDVAVLKTSGLV